ncbi:MAG: hypothetical protein GXO50_01570 [Chlorobi bacterium]|nr:hypothetical protein [Chlorobiota bacterium]
MKTSKIILLSIIAFSVILTVTEFLIVVNKAEKFIKESTEDAKNENKQTEKISRNGKTIKLENFSVINISGEGSLAVIQSENNFFQYFSDEAPLPEIKNDTIFITCKTQENFLYAKTPNTVIVSRNTEVNLDDISTNTLNIKTSGKAKLSADDLKIKNLNILAENSSSIEIYDIKSKNVNSQFILRDTSNLFIEDTENLNLNIKKEDNAKLKIRN